MAQMSYREFIDKVILEDLRGLIFKEGYHYLGFMIMAVAIEFLGMLLDQEDVEKRRRSSKRFDKGLGLFPDEYQQLSNSGNEHDLYTNLRSGLIHQFRPINSLSLTHRKEAKINNVKHLKLYGNQLVLVAEDMYDDLEKAVGELCRQHPSRLDKPFLTIPDKKSGDDESRTAPSTHNYSGTGAY